MSVIIAVRVRCIVRPRASPWELAVGMLSSADRAPFTATSGDARGRAFNGPSRSVGEQCCRGSIAATRCGRLSAALGTERAVFRFGGLSVPSPTATAPPDASVVFLKIPVYSCVILASLGGLATVSEIASTQSNCQPLRLRQ